MPGDNLSSSHSSSLDAQEQHALILSSIRRPKSIRRTAKILLGNAYEKVLWRQLQNLQKESHKFALVCYLDDNIERHQGKSKSKVKPKVIRTILKNLKLITRLKINSPTCRLGSTASLLICLRHLCYLKDLYWRYSSDHFSEYSKNIDLTSTFRDLRSICKLKIEFSDYSKATDKDLQKMLSSLKYHADLSTLNLDLSPCREINENTLQVLFGDIKHLKFLSSLNVKCIHRRDISGDGTKNLSAALQKLTSLASLSLSLQSSKGYLTNETITNLSTGNRCLKSLSILKLNLHDRYNITEKDVESLSAGLQHLTSLSYLDLRLPNYSDITNKGMESLSTSLSHLTSLSTLELYLEKCNHITNKSIQNLSRGIGKLGLLLNLTLKLTGWGSIGDESIETLSASVASLSCLRFLNLKIKNHQSCIGDLGIEALSLGFMSFTLGGIIQLDLDCSELTIGTKEGLTKALKSSRAHYEIKINRHSVN